MQSPRQNAVDRIHQTIMRSLIDGGVPLVKVDGVWCLYISDNKSFPVKLLATRIVDREGFHRIDGLIWPRNG